MLAFSNQFASGLMPLPVPSWANGLESTVCIEDDRTLSLFLLVGRSSVHSDSLYIDQPEADQASAFVVGVSKALLSAAQLPGCHVMRLFTFLHWQKFVRAPAHGQAVLLANRHTCPYAASAWQ